MTDRRYQNRAREADAPLHTLVRGKRRLRRIVAARRRERIAIARPENMHVAIRGIRRQRLNRLLVRLQKARHTQPIPGAEICA